jgi:hypothetical protein
MLGGARQFMNRHDSKKMSGFQHGSGSRHRTERRNWRFRFTHGGERFINRAAVRRGVERLQRLLLRVQTVAVASDAMMSEWRRQVGSNFGSMRNVAFREPHLVADIVVGSLSSLARMFFRAAGQRLVRMRLRGR